MSLVSRHRHRSAHRFVVAMIASAAVVVSALGVPQSATASDIGGNVAFGWQIPDAPASGLSTLTFTANVGPDTQHVDGTYLAYQFGFTGQSNIGYMGLQPRADLNGKGRLRAAFSSFVAGTQVVDGATCAPGADGGPGVSCGVEFDAVYGHDYALTVENGGGDTWVGWATDTVTNTKTRIGAWTLPRNSGLLRSSQVGFLEYYGPRGNACGTLQRADMTVTTPRSGSRSGSIGTPWEYGACVGTAGFTATGVPGGFRLQRGATNPARDVVRGASAVGTMLSVDIDSSAIGSGSRYLILVDGAYVAESFAGTLYYSRGSRNGSTTTVSVNVPALHPGSTVTVVLAPGRPGESWSSAIPVFSWTNTAVRQISASDNTLSVVLDSAVAASSRRIVVDVNGKYAMEIQAGTVYYGRQSTSGPNTTIRCSLDAFPAGSTVSVYLAPGTPGTSRQGQTLLTSWTR